MSSETDATVSEPSNDFRTAAEGVISLLQPVAEAATSPFSTAGYVSATQQRASKMIALLQSAALPELDESTLRICLSDLEADEHYDGATRLLLRERTIIRAHEALTTSCITTSWFLSEEDAAVSAAIAEFFAEP